MKKFLFPLESARALRRLVWERAEEALMLLIAEERQLLLRRRQLKIEILAESRRTLAAAEIESSELERLEHIRRWAAAEDRRLETSLSNARRRAAEQRSRVIEARRQFEVLESLRATQYEQWRQEQLRDEEKTVGELVAARWRAPRPS